VIRFGSRKPRKLGAGGADGCDRAVNVRGELGGRALGANLLSPRLTTYDPGLNVAALVNAPPTDRGNTFDASAAVILVGAVATRVAAETPFFTLENQPIVPSRGRRF
jgi:hypothetical protein